MAEAEVKVEPTEAKAGEASVASEASPPAVAGLTSKTAVSMEKRIEANTWDTDAWKALLREAAKLQAPEARAYYKRFLAQYPTAHKYWNLYFEHEYGEGHYEEVKTIFNPTTFGVAMSVDTYRAYLKYVKFVWNGKPEYRDEMIKAYEFVLGYKKDGFRNEDSCSLDFLSTPIWRSYVDLLKTEPEEDAVEGQNVPIVRKVYRRALVYPKRGIESLWREYCEFERSVDHIGHVAKTSIGLLKQPYENARNRSRELERFTRNIIPDQLAVPPGAGSGQPLQRWLQWISWETNNPMKYDVGKADSFEPFIDRVKYSYKRALTVLRHYERVWLDFGIFLISQAKSAQEQGHSNLAQKLHDDTSKVYTQAVAALPASVVIGFVYADHMETRQQPKLAEAEYERLLTTAPDNRISLVYIQYLKFLRRKDVSLDPRKALFKRVHRDKRCTTHVGEAHARMIPNHRKKILGYIREKNTSDPNAAQAYLQYLLQQPNADDVRELCSVALTRLKGADAAPTWNTYHEFETFHGDLSAVQAVERKMSDELRVSPRELLLRRFGFKDLVPYSTDPAVLASFGIAQQRSAAGMASTPNEPTTAPDPAQQQQQASAHSGEPSVLTWDTAELEEEVELPNLDQMGAFRPNASMPPGVVYPPAVKELLAKLPPPRNYVAEKPLYPSVESVMELLRKNKVPPPSDKGDGSAGAGTAPAAADPKGSRANKRKAPSSDGGSGAPVQDSFRERQRLRAEAAATIKQDPG